VRILTTLRRPLRRTTGLSFVAAVVMLALAPTGGAGETAPVGPRTDEQRGQADQGPVACDGVWRPAPLDDPRSPLVPGLAAPSAVGLGEPFVAFLRHADPVAVTHWQLGLATTNTFGIETTDGLVPPGPVVLRMCVLITNPTAIGRTFSLSVGGEGPLFPTETVARVPFRVTDPEPTAPCAAPLETVEQLRLPFVAGPVFNGQPFELYPDRRTVLMVVAGGMTTVEWELSSTVADADPPARSGSATVSPNGFVHALCLDAIPPSWAGAAATLRLAATDEASVVRDTRATMWVGDPAAPCDGVPRPSASRPEDPAAPAVTGPGEIALGTSGRFRLVLDGATPALSFAVSVPAAQIYAGIPTGGPLIGNATTYELCIRPLDADAVGRGFHLSLGGPTAPGPSATFTVTPAPEPPLEG
jgi:hypothetical protein